MGSANISDPIAHCLVYGIFKRAGTRIDRTNFRSQQTHTEDVQLLPPHVFAAHVHHAVESEQGADGGTRNTVLACSGLCDDAPLAHAPRKQTLAYAVVDFVRSGVEQSFTLEVNAR